MIGAAAYFLAGIFFIIFGTGETQPWNMIVKSTDDNTSPIPAIKSTEETSSYTPKPESPVLNGKVQNK